MGKQSKKSRKKESTSSSNFVDNGYYFNPDDVNNGGLIVNEMYDRIYTKNMFTIPLGEKYARQLHEIFYADIQIRDDLMQKFYEDTNKDNTLTDIQKKLIKTCIFSYRLGTATDEISAPMIGFVRSKNPNLKKINNRVRFKRCLDDIQSYMDNMGFTVNCYLLPAMLHSFVMTFAQPGRSDNEPYIDEDNNENINNMDTSEFEIYLIAAIHSYIKSSSSPSYGTRFYIGVFIRNIFSLSFVNIDSMNEDIVNGIKNLLSLMNIIYMNELNRQGLLNQKEPDLNKKKDSERIIHLLGKSVVIDKEDEEFADNNLIVVDDNDSVVPNSEILKTKFDKNDDYITLGTSNINTLIPVIESMNDIEKSLKDEPVLSTVNSNTDSGDFIVLKED